MKNLVFLLTIMMTIVFTSCSKPSNNGQNLTYGTVIQSPSNGNDGLICTKSPSDRNQPMSWTDAKAYCKACTDGGYKDWRLPTFNEMTQIHAVTINPPTYWGNSIEYWTSDPEPGVANTYGLFYYITAPIEYWKTDNPINSFENVWPVRNTD